MALNNMNGGQKAGLALSMLADAVAMGTGRQPGYTGQSLNQLQQLQRQLLLTQQLEKQQNQETAQEQLAGLAATGPRPAQAGIANNAVPAFTADGQGQAAGMDSAAITPAQTAPEYQAEFKKLMVASDPSAYAKAVISKSMAAPTPISTAKGGRTDFVDSSGNIVQTIKGGDDQPDKVQQVIALYGNDWKTNPKAVDYYNKITMPMAVSLNANTQGENAFEKSQGEAWGKEAADLGPSANLARERIGSIQQFLALSDQVKTGKLTPTMQEVASWAEALHVKPETLGIDPATATAGQVMDKIQNRLAMQNIGPGGLPANNFSEADRKFVQATTVSKANTPQANRLISQIGLAADKRSIEKEQSWLEARNRGTNFPTWKQQWSKYVEGTPMFPKISDPAQLNNLPSGTLFTAPDGTIKVKP